MSNASLQPRERAPVDHGAHERRQIGRVALVDLADHRQRAVAHVGPERVRDVRARRRRALLALVLERAAHERDGDLLRVGRACMTTKSLPPVSPTRRGYDL